MKRKISKFLILFSLSVVLIVASSPFVSAATSSGITISGYQARMFVYGYGNIYSDALNSGNDIFYHFTNPSSSTIDAEIGAWFTLSEYIYGTIELSFTSNGTVYNFDAFNGLYDGNTGDKLCSLTYDSNFYYASYTGYIPTLLELHSYFRIPAGDVLISIKITDIKIERLVDQQAIINNQNHNTDRIINNQNENTDKILNAGSDVEQPDFDSTNGKLDDTTGQMESIEGSYQIDQAATNSALSTGSSFLQGSDMQRASVQVKTWIDTFTSDNPVIYGFLVAAMVLGLCFWVIGRKAGSK